MALIMLLIAGMLAFALTATLVMLAWQAGARLVRFVRTPRHARHEITEPR